jgi:hypothetical protein
MDRAFGIARHSAAERGRCETVGSLERKVRKGGWVAISGMRSRRRGQRPTHVIVHQPTIFRAWPPPIGVPATASPSPRLLRICVCLGSLGELIKRDVALTQPRRGVADFLANNSELPALPPSSRTHIPDDALPARRDPHRAARVRARRSNCARVVPTCLRAD